MPKQRPHRIVSVPLTAAVWLGILGMSPVIVSLYSSDTTLHDSVIAAPRHSFTISQPVSLSKSPLIRAERGTIVFVDTSGKPVSGSGPAGSAANLLIENALIVVSAPQPRTTDKPNTASASAEEQLADAMAPLVDALASARYESLQIRRTTLIVRLNGDPTSTPEPINDVQATISLRRKGTVAIKGSGVVRGQRVDFDAAATLPAGERRAETPVPLKLTFKTPLLEANFDGRLTTNTGLTLNGTGDLSLGSVRQLARWFGAFWSTGPGLRNLTAKGQVNFSNQTLSFQQANIRIDGNDATGALAVGFSGPRPQVTGTLAFTTLNADRYLFNAPSEPREALSWSTVAATALTAPLGQNVDADVRVSADRGQLANLEFGRSAATVTLKDGRLLADIAELNFNGGFGRGQIGADFTGSQPKLSLRGRLEHVDLGGLTAISSGHPMVQANAAVIADLTGTGTGVAEILATLAGKIALRSQDGGRLGIDLKQLTAAVQSREQVGWGTTAWRSRTVFDLLDLKFIVRDGVLLTENAETTSSDGAWSATGVVNLPLQRLDISITPTAPTGQPRPGTSGRPAVLEVRGPWSNPTIRSLSEPNALKPDPIQDLGQDPSRSKAPAKRG